MTSLLLGMRVALRGSRARLVVTSCGVGFAVAFLLAALGALPARQAKLDRLAAREVVHVAFPGDEPNAPLLVESLSTHWFGHPVSGWRVAASPGAPLPPGVHALPAPGELVVSPALRTALASKDGRALLAPRFPGRVVGIIGSAGLTGPHELYAYVGAPRSQLVNRATPAHGWGAALHHEPAPRELKVAGWLGAVALLLPVLVLVATATRLSGAARDRRLAAVRLVGATRAQTARLVAGESGLIGVLGALLGLAAFFSFRGPAASLLPLPDGLFAQDLMPPAPQLLAVLLCVPVLSVLVALVTMRRVVAEPLEVRRAVRARRAGFWRLLPLLAGLGLLLEMAHRDPARGASPRLLLSGGSLTIVGLALAVPLVARLSAASLGRGGVASTLAARRLQADPGTAGRVVTGTVLVVFVGSWLLAFLPLLGRLTASSEESLASLVPGDSVVGYVETARAAHVVDQLRAVPGTQVVALSQVMLGPATLTRVVDTTPAEDQPIDVSVGSCPDLATVLHRNLGCGPAKLDRLLLGPQALPPGARVGVFDLDGRQVARLTLPADAPVLALRTKDELELGSGGWLVDPSLLPSGVRSTPWTMLVARHGGGALVAERIRAVMGDEGALTVAERVADADRVHLAYLRAVRIGVVMALLVGCLSLLVATVDGVRERRQSLAALVALGTPRRTLRRSVLIQMGLPMLANVTVALGAAAVASWAYLRTDEVLAADGIVLPWRSWGLVAGAAVLLVLVVTSLSLPFVSAAGRPEGLRTE